MQTRRGGRGDFARRRSRRQSEQQNRAQGSMFHTGDENSSPSTWKKKSEPLHTPNHSQMLEMKADRTAPTSSKIGEQTSGRIFTLIVFIPKEKKMCISTNYSYQLPGLELPFILTVCPTNIKPDPNLGQSNFGCAPLFWEMTTNSSFQECTLMSMLKTFL